MDIAKSYSNHSLHAEIGKIIRAHSDNKTDIRSIAAGMIDWNKIHRVIDLGCGYGWFEDYLGNSIGRKFNLITGIDYHLENADPFIHHALKAAKEAVFKASFLPAPLDFPTDHFDLAISAYSLYFFPEILPEVKRILRNNGCFLIITHSESMLDEGRRFFDFKFLRTVIKKFSAENGEAILRKHFQNITSIEYHNSLVFHKGDEVELAQYIDFKHDFIKRDANPDKVIEKMLNELCKSGEFRFNKNDKIFLVKK